MTSYVCRIGVRESTTSWKYRVLNVEQFGFDSTDSDRVFHPLMLRSLGTVIGLGGGEAGYMNSNIFPTIIADFGQVNETIPVTCYYAGSGSTDGAKFIDCMNFFSNLRKFIRMSRAVSTNKLYLQFFVQDSTDNADPQVAFDPINTPFGTEPGLGWPGVPSNLKMSPFKAGDGSIKFSFKWQHGRVIPI